MPAALTWASKLVRILPIERFLHPTFVCVPIPLKFPPSSYQWLDRFPSVRKLLFCIRNPLPKCAFRNHISYRGPYFLRGDACHGAIHHRKTCFARANKPEPGHWLDKWESKEFECADEWSRWLCRTVIKHHVDPNAFTVLSACWGRYPLAYLGAQI